jgi:hypothetical protein
MHAPPEYGNFVRWWEVDFRPYYSPGDSANDLVQKFSRDVAERMRALKEER